MRTTRNLSSQSVSQKQGGGRPPNSLHLVDIFLLLVRRLTNTAQLPAFPPPMTHQFRFFLLSLSSPLMPNPIPRPGEERREWLRELSVPCNSCELPLSNTGVGGTELSAERRTAALSRIAPAPDQQPKRRSTYRYIHDRTGITWRRRQFHRRD